MSVSIRSRLLLLVLSVLLPAVLAALWMISQTYHAERRAIENNLRDNARALSLVVDRELAQRAVVARVLAISGALDGAPAVDAAALAAFEQQARRAMEGLGGWVELRAAAGGRPLLTTQTPRAPAASAVTVAVAVTAGTTGDAAVATVGSGPLLDQARVGWLEKNPAGGVPYADIVQPVQRGGRTLLNVAVTILPHELQAIVGRQQLPAGWIGAVIDPHGTVVARQPGGSAFVGRAVTASMLSLMASARESPFESVSLDGVPVIGYYGTSAQGWRYLMAVPRDDIAGALPKTIVQVALGAALLLMLAISGALWVSRRIVAPVVSLKQAAARMQAGLPVEQPATGILECDEVGAALAEASEAMRHARADLERQVADAVARTREAEQRVSRNQRVEALGRLTGGVAHDFNNLLGVISNSAHLIERQAANPALRAPVTATLRAVDTGSRLTRQLLRFSGHQPLKPQAVDLASHLPDVQELLKTVLGKRIEVSVWVAARTRAITVDANELELALINVALNARDALPSGGHVWIKARNAEPHDTAGLSPGAHVLITVTDDGVGMADGLSERAFEPFFTTKAMGQGNGLGLSQLHGFCLQAGGTARLASTPGLGTTVSMVLPARQAELAAEPQTAPPPAAEGLAGKRVLLVEDNEELGAVTAALLTSYGCTVQRASSAHEALSRVAASAAQQGGDDAAAADAFDVVLSDVVMPGGMDGIGLARALREHFAALPVVLISGYSTALAEAREFTALSKPCTPQELVATLRRAMAKAPLAAAR